MAKLTLVNIHPNRCASSPWISVFAGTVPSSSHATKSACSTRLKTPNVTSNNRAMTNKWRRINQGIFSPSKGIGPPAALPEQTKPNQNYRGGEESHRAAMPQPQERGQEFPRACTTCAWLAACEQFQRRAARAGARNYGI